MKIIYVLLPCKYARLCADCYFVDLPEVLHKFIPDFDYLLFSLTDIADDRLTSLKTLF